MKLHQCRLSAEASLADSETQFCPHHESNFAFEGNSIVRPSSLLLLDPVLRGKVHVMLTKEIYVLLIFPHKYQRHDVTTVRHTGFHAFAPK